MIDNTLIRYSFNDSDNVIRYFFVLRTFVLDYNIGYNKF